MKNFAAEFWNPIELCGPEFLSVPQVLTSCTKLGLLPQLLEVFEQWQLLLKWKY